MLGKTDAEGRFDFPDVPVSSYYTFAKLPGYVSPASLIPKTDFFGPPPALWAPSHILDASLHRIQVEESAVSTLDFHLEIGGSLAGRVTWQDGSPAKGNGLTLVVEDSEGEWHLHEPEHSWDPLSSLAQATDENGNFRIDDLYTGRYCIGVRVPRFLPYVGKSKFPYGPAMINCFSSYYWTGNTANPQEAVPVEVIVRKTTSGIDMQIPMLEEAPAQSSV